MKVQKNRDLKRKVGSEEAKNFQDYNKEQSEEFYKLMEKTILDWHEPNVSFADEHHLHEQLLQEIQQIDSQFDLIENEIINLNQSNHQFARTHGIHTHLNKRRFQKGFSKIFATEDFD